MAIIGTTINNRYRLEEKAGEGGFAQVFRATDLTLGRAVAIKLLDSSVSDNIERITRFQTEARAIAALDHPNILPIYDFGLFDETAFLIMPFVPGGTLTSRLKAEGGRLALPQACAYISQVAAALDFAHESGIIHRDVKPSNILMHRANRVVLTDFGFAKFMPEGHVEAPTQPLGTLQYVAPEQISHRVNLATDQYALAVVFYQLVSGTVPFSGLPHSVVMAHLNSPPPPLLGQPALSGIDPAILARLDVVLTRALAKTPADRFPSCEEFAQACWQAIQAPPPGFIAPSVPKPSLSQPLGPLPVPPAPPAPPAANPGDNVPTEQVNTSKQRRVVKPATLEVYAQPDQGFRATFDLQALELKLGRDSTLALQIPLTTVSRHHATLYRTVTRDGQIAYRLVDNASRNGLLFQGKFFKERVLQDGDVIEIGRPGYGDYVVFLVYHAPVFA